MLFENPGILGGPQRQKGAGGRRIGNPQRPFRRARWAETDKHQPDGHARNLRYFKFHRHHDYSVIYLLSLNASLMNRVVDIFFKLAAAAPAKLGNALPGVLNPFQLRNRGGAQKPIRFGVNALDVRFRRLCSIF